MGWLCRCSAPSLSKTKGFHPKSVLPHPLLLAPVGSWVVFSLGVSPSGVRVTPKRGWLSPAGGWKNDAFYSGPKMSHLGKIPQHLHLLGSSRPKSFWKSVQTHVLMDESEPPSMCYSAFPKEKAASPSRSAVPLQPPLAQLFSAVQ